MHTSDGASGRMAAWALASLASLSIVTFVVAVVVAGDGPGPLSFPWPVVTGYATLGLGCTIVGWRIAAERQAIGWVLCAIGGSLGAGQAMSLYADHALYGPGASPGALAAALGGHLLLLGLNVAAVLVLFLFPTGRAPSRRWRRIAILSVAALVAYGLVDVLRPGPLGPFEGTENPLAVDGGAGELVATVADLLFLAMPIAFALAVWSLVARYRRAVEVERLQLRWFAYGASLVATSVALSFGFAALGMQEAADAVWLLVLVTGLFVPISIGVAISRHRLYEIDGIISRTLGYTLTTAILAGVYGLTVLGLGSAVRSMTGQESPLVVAGSTLAAAAAFRPARTWAHRAVERRFNRTRFDASLTVERFGGRLRGELDLEEVSADMVATANEVLGPAHSSIWLRDASPSTR